MKKVKVLGIAAAAILAIGCSSSPGNAVEVVQSTTAEIQKIIQTDANAQVYLLDVRTKSEHASGHLPRTTANANWYEWESEFASLKNKPAKDQKVVVYCRSGGRSSKAAKWLTSQGYTDVHNMIGGFGAWSSSGLPVEK